MVPSSKYTVDTFSSNSILTFRIRYTIAHSGEMPEGARTEGWSLVQGDQFGTLSRPRALLACPVDSAYQVFVQIKGLKFSDDCIAFDALTSNHTQPSAWEYT